jgi:hypothetical protein
VTEDESEARRNGIAGPHGTVPEPDVEFARAQSGKQVFQDAPRNKDVGVGCEGGLRRHESFPPRVSGLALRIVGGVERHNGTDRNRNARQVSKAAS